MSRHRSIRGCSIWRGGSRRIVIGGQCQLGVICNIELGAGLKDFTFLQRATATIGQQYLNVAFNRRNHHGFVDYLGTHIHCSNMTDLDVYTIDACPPRFRCKNVQDGFKPGAMLRIKSKGLFYIVESVT
ncbi:hypothetical protein JM66_14140 [Aeromonas bestiarum]|nr:hypothetical protein JM66_14140 [Aeromonas bestiarum]